MVLLSEMTGPVEWPVLLMVAAVAGGSAIGTWWLAKILKEIKDEMSAGRQSMIEEIATNRRLTRQELSALEATIADSRLAFAWAQARANPGLKVPDPRDPTKLFVVLDNEMIVHQGEGSN